MKKILTLWLIICFLILVSPGEGVAVESVSLGMAVEFTNHAACAYISLDKGWFKEEGLDIKSYESYITGMSLASALARGDIQVAYLCLIPAINVYANAQVPLKIVAGTHQHGYGLVVNPEKIKKINDLEKSYIRIGCIREGGAVDVLLHKIIDKFNLNKERVLKNIQRMNPSKQLLAFTLGQLEAVILPEQWATMAESFGGNQMFLTSQDIWEDMQGSILVVKDELIAEYPEIVKSLVEVSQKATAWINKHPQESAEIMARQLQRAGENLSLNEIIDDNTLIKMTPEILFQSMSRLKYTTEIELPVIQETIDYIAELGYIRSSFRAEEILDLSFIREK